MRIRVRSSRRRAERITLNLASMIDLVFLLLTYFMITTVYSTREDRLSPAIRTRSAQAGEASDFQPQVVEVLAIDGAPSYRVGGRVCRSRDALLDVLDGLPKAVGLFVEVQGGVDVGWAVAALQCAHDAGFEQVTYVPPR